MDNKGDGEKNLHAEMLFVARRKEQQSEKRSWGTLRKLTQKRGKERASPLPGRGPNRKRGGGQRGFVP